MGHHGLQCKNQKAREGRSCLCGKEGYPGNLQGDSREKGREEGVVGGDWQGAG